MRKLAGLVMLATLAACGGGDGHVRATSVATPRADLSVAQLESFAAIRIPADARDLAVQSKTNAADQPVYTAHFSTTPDRARAFCAGDGLGGALLRSAGIDAVSRTRFAIVGDPVQPPFGCRAISPRDPQVQREVFVTVPTVATATVHLIAFRMPR